MKSYLMWAFLALLVLSATSVKGDCEDEVKDDDSWLKKVGCQVKKGAEDAYESVKKGAESGYEAVKPIGDNIATSAKEFGNTVAKKYDEVKHKLTDEDVPTDQKPDATSPILNEPTEKVPLAPISGSANAKSTGEQNTSRIVEPESFDDRFFLHNDPCPPGQALDHKKHCRPRI